MFRNWFFRQEGTNAGQAITLPATRQGAHQGAPAADRQFALAGATTDADYETATNYEVDRVSGPGHRATGSPALAAVDILFFAGATADCWPRGIVRGFVTSRAVVLEGKHKTLFIQGASITEIKCDRRTDSIYVKRTGQDDIIKLTGVRNAEQVMQALYGVM